MRRNEARALALQQPGSLPIDRDREKLVMTHAYGGTALGRQPRGLSTSSSVCSAFLTLYRFDDVTQL
jgi:hypothetical protein